MKNKLILLLFILIPSLLFAQKSKVKLKTENDTISYALGVAIGNSFKSMGVKTIDEKLFTQAIKEVMTNITTAITVEQVNPIVQGYLSKLMTQKAADNLEAGKKFLEENKKKDSIVTTESGLQYKIIKLGEGASPAINSKVTVNYEGKLIDGKVFDSSFKRGEPIQFPVNGVIKGWTEALLLMKPGAVWKLYIPSDLAYGEQGTQGIEPNSVLIFEVHLLSVEN